MVLLTLRHIAQGGITDHIGGGVSRYSVDDLWLVPHFEKMLYDNAQLIELMAHAFLETGDPLFRYRIEDTIAWLVREMRLPGGAFAASLDADSEGHEGKFYVWTPAEIAAVLGVEDGTFFASAYDITPEGNFEGRSIPNRLRSMEPLSEADEARLARDRVRLLTHRNTRIRPATDDKILTDWNGLTIAALAFAGQALHRREWINLAATAFRFIAESMTDGDRLAHAHRAGRSVFPGLATDYAAMTKAALALHAATLDPAYLDKAVSLADTLRRHHWDPETPGYFLSADDAEALIIRPRSTTDEATPSANSVMAANLIRLWHLTGNTAYRRDADDLLEAASPAIAANLFATTGLLNALDLRLNAVDLVLVRPAGTDPSPMTGAALRHWSANIIISVHDDAVTLPPDHPASGKTAINGKLTAYVCRGETCSLPVTDPDALAALLAEPTPPPTEP